MSSTVLCNSPARDCSRAGPPHMCNAMLCMLVCVARRGTGCVWRDHRPRRPTSCPTGTTIEARGSDHFTSKPSHRPLQTLSSCCHELEDFVSIGPS